MPQVGFQLWGSLVSVLKLAPKGGHKKCCKPVFQRKRDNTYSCFAPAKLSPTSRLCVIFSHVKAAAAAASLYLPPSFLRVEALLRVFFPNVSIPRVQYQRQCCYSEHLCGIALVTGDDGSQVLHYTTHTTTKFYRFSPNLSLFFTRRRRGWLDTPHLSSFQIKWQFCAIQKKMLGCIKKLNAHRPCRDIRFQIIKIISKTKSFATCSITSY